MLFMASAVCAIALVVAFLFVFRTDKLNHIPGPRRHFWYGNIQDIDPPKARLAFHKWHKQYGPVIRAKLTVGDVVFVAGFDDLYQMLVANGRDFSGRHRYFRRRFINGIYGILHRETDPAWNKFRKLVHGYIKPYGTGLNSLENLVSNASDQMFDVFHKNENVPLDPMEAINDATVFVLSHLILGHSLNATEKLFLDLKTFAVEEPRAVVAFADHFRLLDVFPTLAMKLPVKMSSQVLSVRKLLMDCWSGIKYHREKTGRCLVNELFKLIPGPSDHNPFTITEDSVQTVCMELMVAGQVTTIATLYSLVHALACAPGVQSSAQKEVDGMRKQQSEGVLLKNKSKMPYIQALIYETLRCFTPVPAGVAHVTTTDTQLPSCGKIPKGTVLFANLWSLHHDESFWGDPNVIRPERFLDENGQLLPATHPKRRHLMPFGAGPRVCIGEVFALSRLFVWTVGLIDKFQVAPTEDHRLGCNWMDPNIHPQDVNLRPLPYKVIFKPRK